MTGSDRYSAEDEILRQLALVRRRLRATCLLAGLAATAAIAAAAALIAAAAAGYWPDQPPALLRWGLLLAGSVAVAAAVSLFLVRWLIWRHNPAQTARFVERALPELNNGLINSVLLARDADQASRELVQAAIQEAAGELRSVDLRRSVSLRPVKRWAIVLALTAGLGGAFALIQPGAVRRGMLAVLRPGAYVPAANDIELVSLSPGDLTCFAGRPLTITAKVRNSQARQYRAEVCIEDAPAGRGMVADESNTTYVCLLERVDQTFRYSVRIGRSRWPADKPYFTVTVIQRVEVKGIDVEYAYPAYTGLSSKKLTDVGGDLEAPVGSKATVTFRLSHAVPAAALKVSGKGSSAMTPAAGAGSFQAEIPIDSDGRYSIALKDRDGALLHRLPAPPPDRAGADPADEYYRIRAIPDERPKVAFLLPGREVSAPPGGKVPLKIIARDDYGVTEMSLLASVADGGPEVANETFPLHGGKEQTVDHELHVPADLPGDGSVTIVYYALAGDNRDLPGAGRQIGRTEPFRIIVRDLAAAATEKANAIDALRKRLLAILNVQSALRVDTEICLRKHTTVAQIAGTAGGILAGQNDIRSDLGDLAGKFDFPPGTDSLRQAISALAVNEARLAAEQAEVLAGLKEFSARGAAAGPLAATQGQIIDALQTMLAMAPQLAADASAHRAGRAGQHLPPEAAEMLSALRDGLDDLVDAQSKIIEASGRLVEKPVDAFDAEDQELLKDLQASQDKWEKFLDEKFTDFSKLAEQDFSTVLMLKELVAVKSDVTMARDALSKKAVEIATAIENNAIENAVELTANIEKWLPDEPDRIKWSMEDPVEQMNVEQAELPGQLEDLVGDLLEEEEDLFDELDDITAQYTMSGDKGIGWDAMDGPIANMSAQGVTGNQLPNTSEMGGRSAEGRTGKSSGEFVQDTAVGKGGRRTPTRLTHEPFQAGQVNDLSAEPPGGATGGGKLSGAGAEGLEGPVPAPLAKELDRLAGRQAAIVNSSQRLQLHFKAEDYSNYRFLKAITLMNRVRNDLRHYRYRNALRARDVTLAALGQAKSLLGGEVSVQADRTAGMPKYVRDNIADAMTGKLPADYGQAVQQYYRRLSEQTGGR